MYKEIRKVHGNGKKIIISILLSLFHLTLFSQKICNTKEEKLFKNRNKLNISAFKFYYNQNENNYEFTIFDILNKESDEFDVFLGSLVIDSIKVNKKLNYIFEQKYKSYKFIGVNQKSKRVFFKDFRKEYFRYNPVNTDTLAGKLVETYQKYNDILIGTHTWYTYKLDQNKEPKMQIDQQIIYDTIYPICWSKAIKLARKKGIKTK